MASPAKPRSEAVPVDEAQVRDQYQTDENLSSRIHLHARYSVNPTPWMDWVFDQLTLPQGGRVLEVGAGPGTLWEANQARLPRTETIIVTDLFPGMVSTARDSLAPNADRFTFGVVDAQDLPFPDGIFDTVLANHVLYHVPQRRRALNEIARVLRSGGTLYATTVGATHMRAMWRLLEPMVPDILTRVGSVTAGFTLDNGTALLGEVFDEVERRDYEDALAITAVDPVLGYLDSSLTMMGVEIAEAEREQLAAAIAARIAAASAFRVGKASGILIARKG